MIILGRIKNIFVYSRPLLQNLFSVYFLTNCDSMYYQYSSMDVQGVQWLAIPKEKSESRDQISAAFFFLNFRANSFRKGLNPSFLSKLWVKQKGRVGYLALRWKPV